MTATDDLPAWAQRCSCGGQGITHLSAEHHEPVGPAVVDPFAGRACPLCGDYVTGPCPTCAASAIGAVARVRDKAAEWATLAPPDDWADTPGDTALADAGRYLLALIDHPERTP